ncbi:MAG: PD-(D/E)XK nuclease family protein [Treponema sp.]|jgi:CRISPR/Cas system-associated exonuclease Cas4 (RecB family)|nr:PD-(D/E)XK nuclease family protein [Treponema sp.]
MSSVVSVYDVILREIKDNNVYFVFPSETAAALWARKICAPGSGVRSVALDRFLAWDRFKESVIRAELRDKKPVSALLRKIFAHSLVRDNFSAPFLRVVIPPDYAENGEAFVRFIASVLPSLDSWEKSPGTDSPDGDDRDFFEIKTRYGSFLRRHDLFEPSWEKPPFKGGSRRYIIFFPETLEDFPEYEKSLSCPQVVFIHPESAGVPENPPELRFFTSAREEIREAVITIRELHEKSGVPYSDMAVSLPGFDHIAPYLVRELSLADIPHVLRAGKGLGSYGAGRLFSLIRECEGSSFSFDSLKALVLNAFIPWKDPGLNRDLVRFGINNHCVSPFTDKTRGTVDVWEEAFKNAGGVELKNHYRLLRRRIHDLSKADRFAKIRERYFAFRELLDMEKCSPENDAALARCVEELSVLADIEEEYPDLACGDPFGFFVSHLAEKNYVPDREGGGINIYDYPVAAGAPFAGNFVLNASQAALTIQYSPLRFLRQDKRMRLGLEDRDVSAAVIRSFQAGITGSSFLSFSAAEKSFSGWAIPHSFFVSRNSSAGEDRFLAEKAWWFAGGGAAVSFPEKLFSIQKKGFKNWSTLLGMSAAAEASGENFTYLEGKAGRETGKILRERIAARKTAPRPDGAPADSTAFSVSATDMTDFFSCSVFWLYKHVFDLERTPIDAAMLDDASLGTIHHKILQCLFEKIREEDGSFTEARLDQYCRWTGELSGEVFRSDRDFKGLLAYPLLDSLASAAARRICFLLRSEAKYFSGFAVDALEENFSFVKGPLRFTGKIDRVSLYPLQGAAGGTSDAVIIDYKTSKIPLQTECILEDGVLKNFQMPMYILLYEEKTKRNVSGAYFFSINKNEIREIVGKLPYKRGVSRERYQETIDSLDEYAGRFKAALDEYNFSPDSVPFTKCPECPFKAICRTTYALNPAVRKTRNYYAALDQDSGGNETEEEDASFS